MPGQMKKPSKNRNHAPPITLFDTTLRDGSQAEDVSFSVTDKIRLLQAFDDFGIHYVEGGWPGSNPKDVGFFKAARQCALMRP